MMRVIADFVPRACELRLYGECVICAIAFPIDFDLSVSASVSVSVSVAVSCEAFRELSSYQYYSIIVLQY